MDVSEDTINAIFHKGATASPPVETPDGGFAMLVPEGYRLEKIAPLVAPLTHIQERVRFHDENSFISYVNRYKDGKSTRLFAQTSRQSGGAATITAILDYHEEDKPRRGAHVAVFVPIFSEEWSRWTKATAPMLQAYFAEFIEENRKDIETPDAAHLLDIVSRFKATKKVEFNSVVYQPNGDLTVGWDERTEGANGQPITIPTQLELGIPVFFKGERYSVPVFLRYRLADQKLTFSLKIDRGDYIEQAAFDQITAKVAEGTGIEVYSGRVE